MIRQQDDEQLEAMLAQVEDILASQRESDCNCEPTSRVTYNMNTQHAMDACEGWLSGQLSDDQFRDVSARFFRFYDDYVPEGLNAPDGATRRVAKIDFLRAAAMEERMGHCRGALHRLQGGLRTHDDLFGSLINGDSIELVRRYWTRRYYEVSLSRMADTEIMVRFPFDWQP